MDITLEIRNMIAEAESEHNDGYTKQYYRDSIIVLKEILDEYISRKEVKV